MRDLQKLAPEDRIGLLADAAALSKAGKIPPTAYLETLAAYKNETNDAVVSTLLVELQFLYKTIARGSDKEELLLQEGLEKLGQSLIQPHLDRLGWDPKDTDAHLARKLRGEVISALPTFYSKDKTVLQEAQRRFEQFVQHHEGLPSEYQSAVYKLVFANSEEPEHLYDTVLLPLYEKLELNEEKKAVLIGLGAAPTFKLRKTVLDLALSDAVKLQDFFYVALSVHGASVHGRDASWAHFQTHFDKYLSKVGDSGSSILDASIQGACSGFASLKAADAITSFFATHPLPRNRRKIDQTVEAVRTNAQYVSAFLQNQDNILQYLKSR